MKDIMWFSSTGAEMSDAEWDSWSMRCLGMLLGCATIDLTGPARTGDPRRHFPSTAQRPVRAGTVRLAWPP